MGRVIFWTIVTVLFMSLLEAAVLSNLAFLPVMPDLVMLVIVYVSFMNSSAVGSTTGFFSGLLLDFLSASPIGLNAFTKTVTGYVAGKFAGAFNLDKIVIPALMGLGATVLKALVTWILSFFFGPSVIAYRLIGFGLWLEIVANVVCAPLIFALLAQFPSLFVRRGNPA
ncbi:MAG TPA: rod shape-determining protein MreD [Treponemataceae bacterium]|nr:rod shape-determining protein MreD [Treponemataceae bacterium]HPS43335.1 rod shape-determining protein MreD [Treponemataceae bacterium]